MKNFFAKQNVKERYLLTRISSVNSTKFISKRMQPEWQKNQLFVGINKKKRWKTEESRIEIKSLFALQDTRSQKWLRFLKEMWLQASLNISENTSTIKIYSILYKKILYLLNNSVDRYYIWILKSSIFVLLFTLQSNWRARNINSHDEVDVLVFRLCLECLLNHQPSSTLWNNWKKEERWSPTNEGLLKERNATNF